MATLLASTVWSDAGLTLVRDKYGAIPSNLLQFTLPGPIELTPQVIWDMVYFVIAIVFVSGVESLLCSRMADRLGRQSRHAVQPQQRAVGPGLGADPRPAASTAFRTPAHWPARRRTSRSAPFRRWPASSSSR